MTEKYSSTIKINTKDDEAFSKWMDLVEKQVFKKLQLMLRDLPDENYRISFEDKISAHEMATIVINDYNNYENFLLS